ncbi:PE domain-containing protein [Mycobacterium haemophilum]|nr:PE domain-containing protein [Mycobacterium haemophilum]
MSFVIVAPGAVKTAVGALRDIGAGMVVTNARASVTTIVTNR